MNIREMIVDERRNVAALLESLTEQQLSLPSLMPTWTVKDVAAHLTLAFDVSAPRILWAFLAARGNIGKAIDELTWKHARRPVGELAASLRKNADRRFAMPGAPLEVGLAEILIHGLDLRWPLDQRGRMSPERGQIVLNFLSTTKPGGFTRNAWRAGLRFEATDVAFSHGDGPLLRGPAEALILAYCGRVPCLEHLEGDGVAVLRERYQKKHQ